MIRKIKLQRTVSNQGGSDTIQKNIFVQALPIVNLGNDTVSCKDVPLTIEQKIAVQLICGQQMPLVNQLL